MTCGAISEPLSLSVGSGSLGQPIQDLISPTVQSGRSKGGSQRTGARTRRVSWRLLRGRHGAAKDEAVEVTSLTSLLCSGAGVAPLLRRWRPNQSKFLENNRGHSPLCQEIVDFSKMSEPP